jgi:hypothetical protein
MKFYVSIAVIILSFLSFKNTYAQNLPNYDFENWVSDGTFNNPVSWGTSNFSVFSIITFNTVFRDTTNSFSGNTCAKLVTVEKSAAGNMVKVLGLITLGYFDVNLSTRKAIVKGGIPFNGRPTKLSGYYQYSTQGVDSCLMSIYLTKHNTAANKTDTLGTGIFKSGQKNEWTYFEAPVHYVSESAPDTMNIIIISSDTSLFVPGSTLLIDKLAIDATTSVEPVFSDFSKYSIFPNPANTFLTISIIDKQNEKAGYSIINSNGIIKRNSIITDFSETIDISSYPPGIYIIELYLQNRKYREKFVVN